jgi:hypothetical protein
VLLIQKKKKRQRGRKEGMEGGREGGKNEGLEVRGVTGKTVRGLPLVSFGNPPLPTLCPELFGKVSFGKRFSLSFSKPHLPPPPHLKSQLQPPKEEKEN